MHSRIGIKGLICLEARACFSVHSGIPEKPSMGGTLIKWNNPFQTLRQTSERMLDPVFIGYKVQRRLYTILGKTSYTLRRLTKHVFAILYTILGKTSL